MAKPTNQKLYDRIKAKVYRDNPKHSAYKEGGTIFRPTKRITKDTPKTMGELTKAEKAKAVKEKKTKGRVKKY